ncbi:wall-associated receptor kinase 2-like [Argentina anserina]|uniref:wall-associated receptor kinase 2-like n=1 Tax=Argentina anserina TaxID=57926 RepID=UPI0021765485|nr:wall-associated receptor kinase 2-like [Potentilla anserina]
MKSGVVVPLPVLLVLAVATSITTTSAQALPNCPDRCGDVKIPYPFGTAEGCYLRDEFFINCTSTEGNAPMAKLTGPPSSSPKSQLTDLIVTDINLDNAELCVLSSIYQECGRGSGGTINQWLRLPSPFAFSTKNMFFAFGCATFAKYRGQQYRPSGRILTPDQDQAYNKSGLAVTECDDSLGTTSCSGNGCSQSPIPSGLQNFTVESLLSIIIIRQNPFQRKWSVEDLDCNYGFLAEQGNFSSSPNISFVQLQKYRRLLVPTTTVVDWQIGNEPCDEAQKNNGSYACKGNSTCVNRSNVSEGVYDGWPQGYICRCLPGYQGNAYLTDGCQDIDECQSSKPCSTEEHCENLPGQYKCVPHQLKTSIRVLISFGTFAIVLVIVVGSLWSIYWGMKKREFINLKENYFEKNGGLLLQQLSSPHGAEMAKIFTAKELEKATNNYDESRILGEGGCGIVYKGILSNNRIVAIKKPKLVGASSHIRSTPNHNISTQQFVNEVVILSQINHMNVVRLLGCCLETSVPILVYEFITNGTLFKHLHGDEEGKRSSPPLFWDLRLKIATETAGALAYLHSSTSTPILHRDVKTMNILLDENYTAKVADFGASQLIRPLDEKQMTTFVQGTLGYLDPEYFHSDEFTEKSDVYSFGVVLVELLTSKKAFSFARPNAERNLSKVFVSSLEEGRLNEILDNEMVDGENMNDGIVIQNVAYLAKRCLRLQGDERPTMREVVMELECLYKGLSPLYDMTYKHHIIYPNETGKDLLGSPTSPTAYVAADQHEPRNRSHEEVVGEG